MDQSLVTSTLFRLEAFKRKTVHAVSTQSETTKNAFHWNPSGRTESPKNNPIPSTPPQKNAPPNSDVVSLCQALTSSLGEGMGGLSGSIPIWTKKHCWLLRASSPPAASKTPDLPAMWEMWGGCNPEFKGHRSWKVCWGWTLSIISILLYCEYIVSIHSCLENIYLFNHFLCHAFIYIYDSYMCIRYANHEKTWPSLHSKSHMSLDELKARPSLASPWNIIFVQSNISYAMTWNDLITSAIQWPCDWNGAPKAHLTWPFEWLSSTTSTTAWPKLPTYQTITLGISIGIRCGTNGPIQPFGVIWVAIATKSPTTGGYTEFAIKRPIATKSLKPRFVMMPTSLRHPVLASFSTKRRISGALYALPLT